MRQSFLPALVLIHAGLAAPALAQPAGKPAPAGQAAAGSSDPDAQCAVQSQNAIFAMMMGGERQQGHLREAGNAFAFFSGRLTARHDPASIAPLIAAAAGELRGNVELQMNAARRCFGALGEARRAADSAFGGAEPRPATPALPPSGAPAESVDADARCLATIRAPAEAARTNSRLGELERRGVENGFAFFMGRLDARRQPGAALLGGAPPQPGDGPAERACIDEARRVIDAVGEAGVEAR